MTKTLLKDSIGGVANNGSTRHEACAGCCFWKRITEGQPMGLCHFNPPTLLLLGMRQHPVMPNQGVPVTDTFWPAVPESEWCGQWRLYSARSEINLTLPN